MCLCGSVCVCVGVFVLVWEYVCVFVCLCGSVLLNYHRAEFLAFYVIIVGRCKGLSIEVFSLPGFHTWELRLY